MRKNRYRSTLTACFVCSITQAVCVNLPPLLFVIFSTRYGVRLEQLALLISFNFILQMLTDLAASKFALKIGYRPCLVAALGFCMGGLFAFSLLPGIMTPFVGLLIAFGLTAVGSGLIEVLTSPIVDAIPAESKSAAMSLLHSFYCWGIVIVVVLTTLFFVGFGTANWMILPMIWAVVPLCGLILFLFAPLPPRDEDTHAPFKNLFKSGLFWLFVLIMLAAGAAEQAVAQWASLFAEKGLGVNKAVGDLLGPCLFGVLMGTARILYGIFGKKINVKIALSVSGAICVGAYALIVFSPNPFLSLIGCGLCGFGVGIAWPGTLSFAAGKIPRGGTTLFALLALGGDIGCALGPGLVGFVSGAVSANPDSILAVLFGASGETAGLKSGILLAIVFPIMLCLLVLLVRSAKKPKNGDGHLLYTQQKNKTSASVISSESTPYTDNDSAPNTLQSIPKNTDGCAPKILQTATKNLDSSAPSVL